VVLALGIAFLQASAMGIGGLAGETAVHTPLEITAVLIQRRGGQGVTAFVNGKGAQQQGLYPGRKPGISRVDGKLTIPPLMGQTDLPVLSGVVLLGTIKIGDPDRWPMRTQDLLDHPVAPARTDDMEIDLPVLKHPCPLLLAVHAGAGFSAADQPTAAQRVRLSATRWSRRPLTPGTGWPGPLH
jgi:hypothetical protein